VVETQVYDVVARHFELTLNIASGSQRFLYHAPFFVVCQNNILPFPRLSH